MRKAKWGGYVVARHQLEDPKNLPSGCYGTYYPNMRSDTLEVVHEGFIRPDYDAWIEIPYVGFFVSSLEGNEIPYSLGQIYERFQLDY